MMRPGAWGRGDQNRVVHIQPRADEAGQEGGGRGQEWPQDVQDVRG